MGIRMEGGWFVIVPCNNWVRRRQMGERGAARVRKESELEGERGGEIIQELRDP
jgi:hypothetical protein